ncbi:MAG TPA: hypothetical protein DER09_12850 [Prolixibacteraceae bacterium]|nr:hypothetical protein [Prolixibacteraceae bacterium]
MSIKTFWNILLKILGIWLILSGFGVIPQFIWAFSIFEYRPDGKIAAGLIYLAALLFITAALFFVILWLFVFRSGWIINKLKLDKGFDDERIDLNIRLNTALTIAIIVIGGLMFADSLPELLRNIYSAFKQDDLVRKDPVTALIILYLAKTTIGYLLMTNSRMIILYITKHNRINETE